jgi:aryl carrier-like protein
MTRYRSLHIILLTFYVSLDLGPIEGSVAITSLPKVQQEQLRNGSIFMKFDELFLLLEYVMGVQGRIDGCVQQINGFDRDSLEADGDKFSLNNPMWSQLPQGTRKKATKAATGESFNIENALRSTKTMSDAHAIIVKAIVEKFASFTSHQADEINPERALIDFGLDSLVAIELKNWVVRTFQAVIQTSEVLDTPSTIALAKLVLSRSKLVRSDLVDAVSMDEASTKSKVQDAVIPKHSYHCCRYSSELPKLPLPKLEAALQQYIESVSPFCTAEEIQKTIAIVENFAGEGGIGRSLYQQLVDIEKDPNVDNWLNDIFVHGDYLSRRKTLAPWNNFLSTHHLSPVPHTQADRAALISVEAAKFKQSIEEQSLETSFYFNTPLCMNDVDWIFSSPREPRIGCDVMRQFPGNDYLVCLRRGHVFKIPFKIPFKNGTALFSHEALKVAFQSILDQDLQMLATPILTADNRDSWAEIREEMKEDPINAMYLEVIERAAFIVSLSDDSPSSVQERVSQFYLDNGLNNWYDSATNFIVAANGTSGMLNNHTMMDGLSILRLVENLNGAINRHDPESVSETSRDVIKVEEYQVATTPRIESRLSSIQESYQSSASKIEFENYVFPFYGTESLSAHGVPVKPIFDMTIQLASFLYRGHFVASWEAISMRHFHKGRTDIVQLVTQKVMDFCRSADNDSIPLESRRELLLAACSDYIKFYPNTTAGQGYFRLLYSLKVLAGDDAVPELFKDVAWNRTGPRLLMSGANDGSVASATFVLGDPDAIWTSFSVRDNRYVDYLL